jgi:dUTP pyrophosphatase
VANFSSPPSSKNVLRYVKLSEKAQAPARAFVATGLTLYLAVNVTIPPRAQAFISTDLRVAVPHGTYSRLIPKSLLTLCHVTENTFRDKDDHGPIGVDLVFDEDYHDPLGVTLLNHHVEGSFQIKEGDPNALLMCETVVCPEVVEVDH